MTINSNIIVSIKQILTIIKGIPAVVITAAIILVIIVEIFLSLIKSPLIYSIKKKQVLTLALYYFINVFNKLPTNVFGLIKL